MLKALAVGDAERRVRDDVQLITISFDPEHDTPEVMALHADALRRVDDSAARQYLTTSGEAALRPLLAAYDQPIGRKTDLTTRLVHWRTSSGSS